MSRIIQYLDGESNQWRNADVESTGNLEELKTSARDNLVNAINSLFFTTEDDRRDINDRLDDMLDNLPSIEDFEGRYQEILDRLLDKLDREEFLEEMSEIQRELAEERQALEEQIVQQRKDFERDMAEAQREISESIDNVRDSLEQSATELEERIREANERIGDKASVEDLEFVQQTTEQAISNNRVDAENRIAEVEQNISNMVNENANRVDEILDGLFDDLGGIRDGLEETRENLEEKLDGLEDTINERIDDFEAQQIENERAIDDVRDDLQTQLDNANEDIISNQAQIRETNEQIRLLASQEVIDVINGRVENNEAELAVQYNMILQRVTQNTLNAETGEIRSSIAQIEVTAQGITQTVTDLRTDLNGNTERLNSHITQTAYDITMGVANGIRELEDGSLEEIRSQLRLTNEQISLMVASEVVDALESRVTTNTAGIDVLSDRVEIGARQVETLESRVTINEAQLIVQYNMIEARVSRQELDAETGRLETNITQAIQTANGFTQTVRTEIENEFGEVTSSLGTQLQQTNEAIGLMATADSVDELTGITTNNTAQITVLNNEIILRARQTEVDELGNRVSSNESAINMLPESIQMWVRQNMYDDRTGDLIGSFGTSIEATIDSITLAVWDTEDDPDNPDGRLTQIRSLIDLTERQILMQVNGLQEEIEDGFEETRTQIQMVNNQISLLATGEVVDALGNRVSTNESQIAIMTGEILLRVTQVQFDELGNRVSSNESAINMLPESIQMWVRQNMYDDRTGDLIGSFGTSIRSTARDITLAVWEDDLEEGVEAMISSAIQIADGAIRLWVTDPNNPNSIGSRITMLEDEITLKVSSEDVTSMIQVAEGRITTSVSELWQDSEYRFGVLESQIQQTNESIGMMVTAETVDNLTGIVSNNTAQINILSNEIDLRVTENEFNRLTGRVESNEASITLLPNQIMSEVNTVISDPTNPNSVYSRLNSQIVQNTTDIGLRVTREELGDAVSDAVAGITIDIDEGVLLYHITRELSPITGELVELGAQIQIMNEQISLAVTGPMLQSVEGRVSTNEAGIRILSDEIDMVVSEVSILDSATQVLETRLNLVPGQITASVNDRFHNPETGQTIVLHSELRIMREAIDLRVTSDELDELFGVNMWIARRYDVNPGIPNFSHIDGLEPTGEVMVRDAVRLTPWTGNQFTVHFSTNVWMSTARVVTVGVRADDRFNFFLNGASIGSGGGHDQPAMNIQIALRQGWNQIDVLKSQGTGGVWLDIAPMLSSQVDEMKAVHGDAERIRRAEAGIRIALDEIAIAVSEIEELDGVINAQGSGILARLTGVELFANQTTHNEFNNRITEAEGRIEVLPTEIAMSVRESYFDPLNDRYTEMSSQIQMLNNSIELMVTSDVVDELTGITSNNTASINILQNSVNINASRIENVDGRIEAAWAEIEAVPGRITLEVGNAVRDLDNELTAHGIISRINMDARGVQIQGARINLTGAVTFNSLNADTQGRITDAQSTANGANTNAQNAQNTANTARDLANTAQAEAERVAGITTNHQTQISNIFADGVLTSVEIRQIRTMRDEIGQERTPIRNQATALGGLGTQLTNEQNAWNALNNFVNGLPTGTNATHNVAEATVRGHFALSAQRKSELLAGIQSVLETRAQNAQNTANTANNTANAAQGTINANQTNWTDAFNRVNDWAHGAVGSTTTIDGGFVQTHTIQANRLALGDFTNLIAVNEHDANSLLQGTIHTAHGQRWIRHGNATNPAWLGLELKRDEVPSLRVGDQFHFRATAFRTDWTNNGVFMIRYMYTNGTWQNASTSVSMTIGTTPTEISGNVTINTPPDPDRTINSVRFFIESSASTTGFLHLREIGLFRRNTGELIVNGTITADHIRADVFKGRRFEGAEIVGGFVEGAEIITTEIRNSSLPEHLTAEFQKARLHNGVLDFHFRIEASPVDIRPISISPVGIVARTWTNDPVDGWRESNPGAMLINPEWRTTASIPPKLLLLAQNGGSVGLLANPIGETGATWDSPARGIRLSSMQNINDIFLHVNAPIVSNQPITASSLNVTGTGSFGSWVRAHGTGFWVNNDTQFNWNGIGTTNASDFFIRRNGQARIAATAAGVTTAGNLTVEGDLRNSANRSRLVAGSIATGVMDSGRTVFTVTIPTWANFAANSYSIAANTWATNASSANNAMMQVGQRTATTFTIARVSEMTSTGTTILWQIADIANPMTRMNDIMFKKSDKPLKEVSSYIESSSQDDIIGYIDVAKDGKILIFADTPVRNTTYQGEHWNDGVIALLDMDISDEELVGLLEETASYRYIGNGRVKKCGELAVKVKEMKREIEKEEMLKQGEQDLFKLLKAENLELKTQLEQQKLEIKSIKQALGGLLD